MPNSSDSRRTRLRQAIAFTVVITATRMCLAAPESGQSADAKSHATELFQQARDAMKAEQYETACAKLEESEHLVPAPGTLLNLAACNEKLGRFIAALGALRKAHDALPPDDSRQDYVTTETNAVESKVAHLIIVRAHPTSGLHVSLDELELTEEALAAPVPVDPGTHHVTVTAPAHEKKTYDVALTEGQDLTLNVHVGAPVSTTPPGTAAEAKRGGAVERELPASSTGTSKHVPGYIALGVGGLGLAVSGVTGILVLNKKSTMNDHCDKTFACDPTGLDAASSGKTLSTVSTVSFVVGAVGVGLGLYLLLTASDEPQRPSAAAFVAPNGHGADVGFRGRF